MSFLTFLTYFITCSVIYNFSVFLVAVAVRYVQIRRMVNKHNKEVGKLKKGMTTMQVISHIEEDDGQWH